MSGLPPPRLDGLWLLLSRKMCVGPVTFIKSGRGPESACVDAGMMPPANTATAASDSKRLMNPPNLELAITVRWTDIHVSELTHTCQCPKGLCREYSVRNV